jgi:BirA family transcriptional regulator, biotin operon repressor / biotin---[acetyl-CoA-carboxylase] ligase
VTGPGTGRASAARIIRLERLGCVTSTQDVVRGWLADGQPEICLAVADEQTEGRGRLGRRWLAAPGGGLLLSAGLRPTWLPIEAAWRLMAVAALALLEPATALLESATGQSGTAAVRLALKWPNDIVAVRDGVLHKVGGLLAESAAAADGTHLDRLVLGLGVNVDWPATTFPPELADSMTSLSELAGAPIDREALLAGWLARMGSGYLALADGEFEAGRWAAAQATTGAWVSVTAGERSFEGRAEGVDADSGALLVRDAAGGELRRLSAGEVRSCRIAASAPTPEQPAATL